jgi:hypothetical protein
MRAAKRNLEKPKRTGAAFCLAQSRRSKISGNIYFTQLERDEPEPSGIPIAQLLKAKGWVLS